MPIKSLDWAAGLFEGEGTILSRTRSKDQIGLSLTSTDEDIVRAFHATVLIGKVYGPYHYDEKRKPFWKWSCDKGLDVISLLRLFLPLLGYRRGAKAQEVLTRYEYRQTLPHYLVSRKGMGGRANHKNINGVEHIKTKNKGVK